MARVTGPLMSIDASGTYGKTLVYGKWKGRNVVRQRVIPANPKSAKQVGVRALMGFVAAVWDGLSALAKGSWDELATSQCISPFNAYVGANLSRWQNFNGPTQSNPAAEASTPLTVSDQTLTGGVKECTVSLTPSGSTNIWGFAIFRDTASITAPSWTNCIAVIEANGTNAVTYVDTPLEVGTYHYRSAVLNVDGVIGTVVADETAVVT